MRDAAQARHESARAEDGAWRGSPSAWRDLAVVCGIALIARLAWIAVVHPDPVSDYLFYYMRGGELASGLGFNWRGHPTAFWPPGYPAFLGVVFWVTGVGREIVAALAVPGTSVDVPGAVLFAQIANSVLWTISAGCVWFAGWRLGGRAVGLFAGLAVALWPDFVIYAGLLGSENLAVALLAGGFALLAGAQPGSADGAGAADASARLGLVRLGLAGALFGLACLVRPAVTLLVALLAAVMVVRALFAGRRAVALVPALVFSLVAATPVVGWMIRNAVVMGEPVLATEAGITMWISNNPDADGSYRVPPDTGPLRRDSIAAELEENRLYSRKALDFITTQPGVWLSLVPAKATGLFESQRLAHFSTLAYPPGAEKGSFVKRETSGLEKRVIDVARSWDAIGGTAQIAWWVLGTLGLVVALRGDRRARPAASLLVAAAGYWVVFHVTLAFGHPRFLLSLAPLLAPGIGYLAMRGLAATVVAAIRPSERPGTRRA